MEEFNTKDVRNSTITSIDYSGQLNTCNTYRPHFQTYKTHDNCTRRKQQFPSKLR